jgi:TetR/AcrR family transcriptional repressor of nem operon
VPPEPKTSKGRASRERIVESAAELVATRGVHATSLDDVRAATGASKSQLYHYFADRDELVESAVGLRCEQVVADISALLGQVTTFAQLQSALGQMVKSYEGHPAGCPIGTLAAEVVDENEPARLHTVAAFAAWEGLIANALTQMRDRGELRSDAKPDVLATGMLASLEGGLLLSQVRRDATSLRIAFESALGYVATYKTLD